MHSALDQENSSPQGKEIKELLGIFDRKISDHRTHVMVSRLQAHIEELYLKTLIGEWVSHGVVGDVYKTLEYLSDFEPSNRTFTAGEVVSWVLDISPNGRPGVPVQLTTDHKLGKFMVKYRHFLELVDIYPTGHGAGRTVTYAKRGHDVEVSHAQGSGRCDS